jgi:hypothetical protein
MEDNLKRVKIISALAAVALLAIAALGASSATAGTVLCSEEFKSHCSPGAVMPVGSTITTFRDFSSTSGQYSFVIQRVGATNEKYLKCRDSQITLKSLAQNQDPLPAEFKGSVPAGECQTYQSGSSCSGVSVNGPTTQLHATGNGNGVAKIYGPLTVSFTCKYQIMGITWNENCSFAATGPVEMAIYSGYGSASINTPLTKTSGNNFCSEGPLSLAVSHELNPVTQPDIAEYWPQYS